MDSGGWQHLQAVPKIGRQIAYDTAGSTATTAGDASAVSHGFLAEGAVVRRDALDLLARQQFEVTTGELIGPGAPGSIRYLNRIVGCKYMLLDDRESGVVWRADLEHVDAFINWSETRGSKLSLSPGFRSTGLGQRDSCDLLSKDRAREVAGAGRAALFLSPERPDTMYASKIAMQNVYSLNVVMSARLQRFGRHHEGWLMLMRRYPLQDMPREIRVDDDGDWIGLL